MKLRSLTIGLSLLATGTVIGVATQQFASADVTSGDRPVLVPIDTCRIADTRPAPNTVGPRTSPLGAGDTMEIDAQQSGTDCAAKIPPGATALSLNVTALDATSNSFLTIWPGGQRPEASALNPAPGQRVFNAVTTELAADQTFQIFNNRGTVNVFVDVNGYYEDHNHDDRYYEMSQSDDRYVARSSTIDLAPSEFRPLDAGWTLEQSSIARVFGQSGLRCAVAPVDLATGSSVTSVSVNFRNFGASTALRTRVSERPMTEGRFIGGTNIASIDVPLPKYEGEFTVWLASAATSDPAAASSAASHQIEICTAGDRVDIHGVQLSIAP